MTEPVESWVPAGVDVTKPSAARAYDAFLGGSHNFEADREFARKAEEVFPGVALSCQANRDFLRRAVLFGLNSGVRQFLDLGSGIPTVGNVHEVAQAVDPQARVVYVDNEPVAVAHSELLLANNDNAIIVRGDVRDPDHLLEESTQLIDFDEPVMLLMLALLHFIPDDDEPEKLVARFREGLPSGSYLAITHATDAARPEEMKALEDLYATSSNPAVARSPEWIKDLFGDFELVSPGAVFVPEWRPDAETTSNPENYIFFGGVGKKN